MNVEDELQKLYLADKTLERLLVKDALDELSKTRTKYARLEILNSVWREVDYLLAPDAGINQTPEDNQVRYVFHPILNSFRGLWPFLPRRNHYGKER